MVRGATGSGVRCKYVMIGERQNLKAQRATDAKHLDFGDIIL